MRKNRVGGDKHMLPWYGKLFYGSGALSYAIAAQTVLGLIMLFATDAHGMPAWLAGLAVAIGFMAGAAADPVAAYFSGRTKSLMFGRRFGFILPAVFFTAFLNIILFAMPGGVHAGVKFLWLMGFVSLLNISLSAFSVPYSALGHELAGGKRESEAVAGCRTAFLLAALAAPVLLFGLLITDTKAAAGYTDLALINSSIVLISGLLCFFAAYPHLPRLNAKTRGIDQPKLTFKQIFGGLFEGLKERNIRYITLGYAVSMTAPAFLAAAGLLFFRYTMDLSTAQTAIALGVMFLFIIASQPLWVLLSKRYDKKKLILISAVTSLAGILLTCVIFSVYRYAGAINDPVYLLAAAMGLIGAGGGAMHAVPQMMLNEAEAASPGKGRRTELMPFMFKAAAAAAMLLTGILLTAFGFKGGAQGQVQSGLTKDALGWIVILGSGLAIGAAVYFYMKAGAKPGVKKEQEKKGETEESV